jgi:hypothetical protein
MRFATVGPISLNDWLENADSLRRHFFNAPRRRAMQQADVLAAILPVGLS